MLRRSGFSFVHIFVVVSSPSSRGPVSNVETPRKSGDVVKQLIKRFLRDESGATAIEYGLIAGLVGTVIITAVTSTGTKVSGQFSKVSAKLN